MQATIASSPFTSGQWRTGCCREYASCLYFPVHRHRASCPGYYDRHSIPSARHWFNDGPACATPVHHFANPTTIYAYRDKSSCGLDKGQFVPQPPPPPFPQTHMPDQDTCLLQTQKYIFENIPAICKELAHK